MRKLSLSFILASVLLSALAGCSADKILQTDDPFSSQTTPGVFSWSASEYEATIGSSNHFPTLVNAEGLDVTYASSNPYVATISDAGVVTLVAEGTTVISASSRETARYDAMTVSYTLTVKEDGSTRMSADLSWPVNSCTAILEEVFISPVLDNPHGLSVKYSSSDTSVATIDEQGAVTLLSAGVTKISALSATTDMYLAGLAQYTLLVTDGEDDGAVITLFDPAGDSSSSDDISNTTFTRLVTVTYASGGAAVTGYTAVADSMSVSVNGNQVIINHIGHENVVYKLTGTASDGSFKLYSIKKQALWLSGLSLANSGGAAINNQSGKRTFVYVDGTNTLADGASAGYSTSADEDLKGVFFSEGQLIFSGSGSLKVTANNAQAKSGIVSDDYVRMMDSPTISITSGSKAGHGIKANDYVQLSGGYLNISTAAAMKKGIKSDDFVLVEGGTTTIKVTGGVAYDSEDAEYTGTAGIKADNYFAMTGGTLTIENSGSGGKGIRAGSYDFNPTNHTVADSYISGGTLKITTSGSESNDVSAKGIKIGWVTKKGSGDRATVTGYAGNLNISGGRIYVSASRSEGIEAKGDLVISGGETYVSSTGDDAINCQAEFDVTGGYLYAYSSQNDAMDANHDMKLSGGYVFAVTTKGAPEVALDANTEQRYALYIESGATVVAYGGLENGYSSSQSVYSMSCLSGKWNALHNGTSYIAAFKAPSGVSSVAVSAPSLNKGYTDVSIGGTTYCNDVWATSGISGGSSVTLDTYSGGGGSPGGPGGGPPPVGGGHH